MSIHLNGDAWAVVAFWAAVIIARLGRKVLKRGRRP